MTDQPEVVDDEYADDRAATDPDTDLEVVPGPDEDGDPEVDLNDELGISDFVPGTYDTPDASLINDPDGYEDDAEGKFYGSERVSDPDTPDGDTDWKDLHPDAAELFGEDATGVQEAQL